MIEIYNAPLNVEEILSRWYNNYKDKNYGAFINFVGIVRDENGIEGLSFDIYKPILEKWFKAWQKKAKEQSAYLLMAHSNGDVPNHRTSYISAVLSPERKVSLKMIEEFVEDFKANAPIWKYDIKNGKREYALDRSTPIEGSGILS